MSGSREKREKVFIDFTFDNRSILHASFSLLKHARFISDRRIHRRP
jgi:hypothetical protein